MACSLRHKIPKILLQSFVRIFQHEHRASTSTGRGSRLQLRRILPTKKGSVVFELLRGSNKPYLFRLDSQQCAVVPWSNTHYTNEFILNLCLLVL